MEPVYWDILLIQIIQIGPPTTVKITDAVPLAKRTYDAPVSVWHGEPLAITRSDIYVDGTKIVVLLVTGCSTTGYLRWNDITMSIRLYD